MSERDINAADVRREHLKSVHVPAHWLYLGGVLGLSFLVMLGLIVFLGGTN